MDTDIQYKDLQPGRIYIIDIFPSIDGAVGNVDATRSSWIVQTLDDGELLVAIAIATHNGMDYV